jgi:hypothetical protein
MTNPWERNEGRFDKPSSTRPGQAEAYAPKPAPTRRPKGEPGGIIGKSPDRVIIDDPHATARGAGVLPPRPFIGSSQAEQVAYCRAIRAGIGEAIATLEAKLPPKRERTFRINVKPR